MRRIDSTCAADEVSSWHVKPVQHRDWLPQLRLVSPDAHVDDAEAESLLADEFRFQADKWLLETANSSSIRDMVMHPSYQRIIGMGRDVLPLIFERLSASPDPWFWALRAITGENPVDPRDAGRIQRVTEAWLAWARDRKLTR